MFVSIKRVSNDLPRFWHSKLSWKDGLDVPGEDPVEDGVNEEHTDAAGQGVLVSGTHLRTRPDVVPLRTHSVLLEVGEISAAESESNVGE